MDKQTEGAFMRLINILNHQGQILLSKEVSSPTDVTKAFKECWNDGLSFKHVDVHTTIVKFNLEHGCHVKSVLYVEDEEILGLTTKKFAEKLGHFYHSVLTAEHAIKIISKQPRLFDVVFVDRNLPGLNGDEFAIRLKSFNPALKIYIVTGEPQNVQQKILKCGIERVIVKPFRFECLKNIVGTFDGTEIKEIA